MQWSTTIVEYDAVLHDFVRRWKSYTRNTPILNIEEVGRLRVFDDCARVVEQSFETPQNPLTKNICEALNQTDYKDYEGLVNAFKGFTEEWREYEDSPIFQLVEERLQEVPTGLEYANSDDNWADPD